MANGLYLYGIFPHPGPTALELQGLDKQPVNAQEVDGFVFLYSEAQQERYLASRRNLLGHEQVLENAMEHGYRTLLPLQFGLIIDTWDSVRDQLLIPQGDGLKQLFSKLDGKREVSIKVLWDETVELEALMAEQDDLRAMRDSLEGTTLSMDQIVRIGQMIEKAMAARKQNIIETFQTTLSPMAVESVENDPLTNSMIYNAAYLIEWDLEPQVSEAVEALDEHFGGRLKIRYNNFTAPFNFAQLEA